MNGAIERREAFKAMAEEKSLRAQGQRLKSQQVAIAASAAAQIRAEGNAVSDNALINVGESDKLKRREEARRNVLVIRQAETKDLTDLGAEEARREQEQHLRNQEKIKTIDGEAAIDGARMKDEILNERFEREGMAQRSHLAEALKIEEEHRRAIDEVESRYREEHRASKVDPKDRDVMDGIAAADEKRRQAIGLEQTKAAIEAGKNQLGIVKELRKAWEETGDPLRKYQAKLQEIQAQYRKLRDDGLRKAQIDKLDSDTMKDLRQANPDRSTKVDHYDRSNYAYLPTDHGDSAAQNQLTEIKKQSQLQEKWSNWFYDIWRTATTSSIVTELNI